MKNKSSPVSLVKSLIMTRLVTLGKLRLEGDTFSERLPLLILAYLCLEGKSTRYRLTTLFWPEQPDTTKRSKNLSEVLRKLSERDLVVIQDETIEARVENDIQAFVSACQVLDLKAQEIYQGDFLEGLEDNQRLALGEELMLWLTDRRDELQNQLVACLLDVAQDKYQQGFFDQSMAIALDCFNLPESKSHPSEVTLKTIYKFLLHHGKRTDIEKVKVKAQETFGLNLASWLEGLATKHTRFCWT